MRFLIIYVSLLLPLVSCAVTLKAGVSYTIEEARAEAFSNLRTRINIGEYEKFLFDENKDTNLRAWSNGKKKYKDRLLTSFSDNCYAVVYKKNLKLGFYYDKNGRLYSLDISDSEYYPRKTATYNANGKLTYVSLELSKNVQYIFDLNKKLIAHWIGKNGYNEKGELFGTRN